MKRLLLCLSALFFLPETLSNTLKREIARNDISPELEVKSFSSNTKSGTKIITLVPSPERPTTENAVTKPRTEEKLATKLKYECSKAMRKPHQTPSNTKILRLYCKNGYILEVSRTGLVRGTEEKNSPYTLFELQSLGPGIIRIKSHLTGYYIAMDRKGVLYLTRKPNDECLFAANQLKNFFVTYQSCKRYLRVLREQGFKSKKRSNQSGDEKWYIGLKRDGKSKRGQQTVVRQSGTQFLPIEVYG